MVVFIPKKEPIDTFPSMLPITARYFLISLEKELMFTTYLLIASFMACNSSVFRTPPNVQQVQFQRN